MRPILALAALACLLTIANCNCKHACRRSWLHLSLVNYDSTQDTAVLVIRYKTGTNLAIAADSMLTKIVNGVGIDLTAEDVVQYDYALIFYPVNKRHTLTSIRYGNEQGQENGNPQSKCYASLTYTLDNNRTTVPELPDHPTDSLYLRN